MKIKVHLLPTRMETKTIELEDGATVESLVRKLGLFPDAWIAVRGKYPVPLDERLRPDDEIDLIAVVSGG